jgi:hypothetical protein
LFGAPSENGEWYVNGNPNENISLLRLYNNDASGTDITPYFSGCPNNTGWITLSEQGNSDNFVSFSFSSVTFNATTTDFNITQSGGDAVWFGTILGISGSALEFCLNIECIGNSGTSGSSGSSGTSGSSGSSGTSGSSGSSGTSGSSGSSGTSGASGAGGSEGCTSLQVSSLSLTTPAAYKMALSSGTFNSVGSMHLSYSAEITGLQVPSSFRNLNSSYVGTQGYIILTEKGGTNYATYAYTNFAAVTAGSYYTLKLIYVNSSGAPAINDEYCITLIELI